MVNAANTDAPTYEIFGIDGKRLYRGLLAADQGIHRFASGCGFVTLDTIAEEKWSVRPTA